MSEWISVEDRLPKHGQHVLGWSDSGPFIGDGDDDEGRLRIGDCVYCSDQNEWLIRGGIYFGRVSYWMPPPEPPTQQQQ